MFRLAERSRRIDASGIRRVFDLARTIPDPINLSIGQPDFPVPEAIKLAAIEAIQGDRNGYTPTQGIAPLIEQCISEESATTGCRYQSDQMLVTSGVSGGLFLALLALVEEGDEVIIPDPYFVMYKHLVRLFGGVPVWLDTYDTGFTVEPDRVEALITPRTKLLLLNGPSNPTGRVIDASRLQGIAAICQRHGLGVVSDEIYRRFAYVEAPSISTWHDQTLVLMGHSKTFGMTGWRLGYACGPRDLVQAMAKVQQYSFVCAPAPTQYAALACPQVDMSAPLAAYRAKRDLMVSLLQPHFRLGQPDGAFYLFVEAPAGLSGTAFVERALARRVLVIPGGVFSERDTHFRLCYTVPEAALREGADVLCALARSST